MNNKYGYCQCGCGQKTKVVERNINRKGIKKGDYRKYIHGHNKGTGTGENHYGWNGGKIIKGEYLAVLSKDHPRADRDGYVYEHILIAEEILREYLPLNAVVHHIDGNKKNNSHNNLVVCQDNSYHLYLHQRDRAYKKCGNADWLKCNFCKQYEAPEKLSISGKRHYHNSCYKDYMTKYRNGKALQEVGIT